MTRKPLKLTDSQHKTPNKPPSVVMPLSTLLNDFSDKLNELIMVLVTHNERTQMTIRLDPHTMIRLGLESNPAVLATPGGLVRIEAQTSNSATVLHSSQCHYGFCAPDCPRRDNTAGSKP